MPDYLRTLNNIVVGISFTVVVDKEADASKSECLELQKLLIERGYKKWKPKIVQKLTTVVYVISYFIKLLAKKIWAKIETGSCNCLVSRAFVEA